MNFLKRKTLREKVSIEGVGIHTGEISKITVHPSENRGIFFLSKGVKIPALHRYVCNTESGTDLCKDGVKVKTVEHLMAAFYLLGIDSALVEVEGPEIPIADGSSKLFFDLFKNIGLEELEHYQPNLKVFRPYRLEPNGKFAVFRPYEGERFTFETELPYLGRRRVTFDGYAEEKLVGAKTFCNIDDIPIFWIRKLGKGGSLINTLVLDKEHSYLVYREEPFYHKLLDLIGDLALLGARIRGDIYVFNGNHAFNGEIRKVLLKGEIAKLVQPEAVKVEN